MKPQNSSAPDRVYPLCQIVSDARAAHCRRRDLPSLRDRSSIRRGTLSAPTTGSRPSIAT